MLVRWVRIARARNWTRKGMLVNWAVESWVRERAYVAGADVLLGADVVVDEFEEELGFVGDELDKRLEVGFVKVCGWSAQM